MSDTKRIEQLEAELAQLQQDFERQDEAFEQLHAEFMGFKMAIAHLIPFLPIARHDATNAQLLATDMAEDAMAQDDIDGALRRIAFEAILKLTQSAGVGRAPDASGPTKRS